MQGIDILSKTEIMARSTVIENAMNITLIIMVVSVLLGLIFMGIDYFRLGCICLGLLLTSFITCLVLFATAHTYKTGRYQYKVTIDDSVSFNDLYEKYNVIDQDGKIFIIEDKEK